MKDVSLCSLSLSLLSYPSSPQRGKFHSSIWWSAPSYAAVRNIYGRTRACIFNRVNVKKKRKEKENVPPYSRYWRKSVDLNEIDARRGTFGITPRETYKMINRIVIARVLKFLWKLVIVIVFGRTDYSILRNKIKLCLRSRHLEERALVLKRTLKVASIPELLLCKTVYSYRKL